MMMIKPNYFLYSFICLLYVYTRSHFFQPLMIDSFQTVAKNCIASYFYFAKTSALIHWWFQKPAEIWQIGIVLASLENRCCHSDSGLAIPYLARW